MSQNIILTSLVIYQNNNTLLDVNWPYLTFQGVSVSQDRLDYIVATSSPRKQQTFISHPCCLSSVGQLGALLCQVHLHMGIQAGRAATLWKAWPVAVVELEGSVAKHLPALKASAQEVMLIISIHMSLAKASRLAKPNISHHPKRAKTSATRSDVRAVAPSGLRRFEQLFVPILRCPQQLSSQSFRLVFIVCIVPLQPLLFIAFNVPAPSSSPSSLQIYNFWSAT